MEEQHPDTLIQDIYMSEYASMLRFAQTVLESTSLGEVAVQEAFLVALRKRDAISNSPEPVGWIYKTLKYVIRDMLKEKRAMLRHMVSDPDLDQIAAPSKAVDPILGSAVAEDEEMQLLYRFYVVGFSIRELASQEGITEAAMKMRLYRARKTMAKIFKE